MGDSATTDPQLLVPDLARAADARNHSQYEQKLDTTGFDEEPLLQASPEPDYRRSRAMASCSGRNADGMCGVLLPSGSLIRLHGDEMQDMQDAYAAQEVVLNGLASTVAAVGTTVGATIIKSIDNLSTYLVEMSQHLGGFPGHEPGAAWSDDHMREVHASRAHGACKVTVASSGDALRSDTQHGSPLKQRVLQTTKASTPRPSPRDAITAAAPAVGAAEGKGARSKRGNGNTMSMLDADDWYVAGYDPQEWQAAVQHRKDD